MRKIYCLFISAAALTSCEKVWVEDLQKKAFDTIRGEYEIESVTWEGPEPIDINGDGQASFDYYEEWDSVISGSPCSSFIYDDGGYLGVPYTVDQNADWNGSPSLARRRYDFEFGMKAVVEGNEAHLEFQLPVEDCEFNHSGYGEITLRINVTLTVMTADKKTEEKSGPVFIKYVRSEYRIR